MFLKNTASVLISALLAFLLSLLLNQYTQFNTDRWYFGIYFFAALCFILNLVYAWQRKSRIFTQLLIAGVVVKLVLALTAIIIYSFLDHAGFFNFSIHFVAHYILFTIFEIRFLLYIIKTTRLSTHEN
jgi:hypothetical protein